MTEAAAILGVPNSEIQNMIDGGKVKTLVRDNAVYLRSSDLEDIARGPAQSRQHLPHKALRWAAAAAAGAIIVGSLLPNVTIGEVDKEAHWLAYLVLSTLTSLSVVRVRTTMMAISLVLVFGALLEYLQHFIPGRNFELDDLAANYLGVISGVILGFMLKRHRGPHGRVQEV